MHALNEMRHAVAKKRVPEVSVFFAQCADTGWFKSGDLQVPDMAGWSADPLETIIDACEPVVEHCFEPGVITCE